MTFNFSTTKGIRAVADHLDALAAEAPGKGEIRIGHLRLVNSTAALTRAATLLRSNSRSGSAYQSPRRPSRHTLSRNIRMRYHDPDSHIFSLDAVHLCGSPEAALETIRRQLDIQGAYMEPASLKSCQKAAEEIAAFLDREETLKRQKEEDDAAEARIKKATTPDPQALTPAGTEVMISHSRSSYMGTVIECRIGPHPQLGKKYPTAIHTVEITHIHETRDRRYALYPIPKKQLLIPAESIRILPPSPNQQSEITNPQSPISSSSTTNNSPLTTHSMKSPTILHLPAKFISAASTDKSRAVLAGILIDAENRAVVACNGTILAKTAIPGTEPIRSGYITPELWKSATIMAKKGPVILDFVTGTIAGLPYPDLEEWGMTYPNWSDAIPDIGDPVFRTRIDPKILLDCALALGYHPDTTDCKGITLDFAADPHTPILLNVHGNESSGVIMPMGDEKNTCGHGLRTSNVERPTSNIEVTPEHSPDITALQSERDTLAARLETTTRELTQARHRITALETAAKHRKAVEEVNGKLSVVNGEASSTTHHSPLTTHSSTTLQPLADQPPTLTRNGPKNGIELRFNGKPTDITRDALKSMGFRWAPGQPDKPWIAKYTEERWVFATALSEGRTENVNGNWSVVNGEEIDSSTTHHSPITPHSPATRDIFADF